VCRGYGLPRMLWVEWGGKEVGEARHGVRDTRSLEGEGFKGSVE